MILFPHAKINLGLNVLARRSDGYHDIESVFVPIPLHDVLEAVLAPELGKNGLEYTRTGLPIPGSVEGDLCHKAVRLLQGTSELPGLRLHLHKVVPMGAGLGGGSSDGARMLLLVNELCSLGLSREVLGEMALRLGSDCPFFLQDRTCIVRGRGERSTPIDLDLSNLWLVLANPGVHVGTAEVYKNTVPTERPWDIETVARRRRIGEWKELLPNTMEPYVLKAYPVVNELKRTLEHSGAAHVSMSGSGSSVFGLFEHDPGELVLPAGTAWWKMRL